MELRDLFSEAAAGLDRAPGAGRPDRARHGDRGCCAGGDPGPVEDRRQSDRGPVRPGRGDRRGRHPGARCPTGRRSRRERDPVGCRGPHEAAERRRAGGHPRRGERARPARALGADQRSSGPDGHPASRACRIARSVAGRTSRACRRTAARCRAFGPRRPRGGAGHQRSPPARDQEPRPAARDLHRRPPVPGDRPGRGSQAPGVAARVPDDPERHRAARVRARRRRAPCRSRPRSARSS